MVDMTKKILAAAAYSGLSQTEIAQGLNMSLSNFSQRVRGRGFKDEELEQIAQVIGAKYEAHFEFPDGTRI